MPAWMLQIIVRSQMIMVLLPQDSKISPNQQEVFMKLSSVIFAVVACTSLVFAQSAKSGIDTLNHAGKSAAKSDMQQQKEHMMNVMIVSVDPAQNMLVVMHNKAADTLWVTGSTSIMKGTKKITLSDLLPNEKIMVAYTMENGKRVAKKILWEGTTEVQGNKKKSSSK